MNFLSTFRVHLTDPLGFVDSPIIITTAYTTPKELPRSEWFLIVPEGKGLLFSQRSKLDLSTFPEKRMRFDEELLLEDALDQARLRLRKYIQEKKEKLSPLLLAKQTEVQASNQEHLAKVWMRGAYCGSISEIRAKSECPALIDTLIWIHGLPMLTIGDI
jgi:hypothetical protein